VAYFVAILTENCCETNKLKFPLENSKRGYNQVSLYAISKVVFQLFHSKEEILLNFVTTQNDVTYINWLIQVHKIIIKAFNFISIQYLTFLILQLMFFFSVGFTHFS
jgi:hypothetical protein